MTDRKKALALIKARKAVKNARGILKECGSDRVAVAETFMEILADDIRAIDPTFGVSKK